MKGCFSVNKYGFVYIFALASQVCVYLHLGRLCDLYDHVTCASNSERNADGISTMDYKAEGILFIVEDRPNSRLYSSAVCGGRTEPAHVFSHKSRRSNNRFRVLLRNMVPIIFISRVIVGFIPVPRRGTEFAVGFCRRYLSVYYIRQLPCPPDLNRGMQRSARSD